MKNRNRSALFRRLRAGSGPTVLLCLFLVLIVLLNSAMTALEKKHGWRVDYSFNALTTQSEATLEILAGLKHPVHIYALFTKGQEDGPLMELLDRYSAASELVTWEQTDAAANPGLMTKYRGATDSETVSADSLIVACEETGRFRILSPADFISLSLNYEEGVYEIAGLKYESEITSAIAYVTADTVPRVLIAQGEGELDENGTAVFSALLTNNRYSVRYVSLASADTELLPEDVLVLLSPTHDLSDASLRKITDFTAAGGSLLVTCDYTDPVAKMPNYASLLRSYGFLPKDGIVVASKAEPDTYYDDVRIDLLPQMLPADLTMSLVTAGADTLLLAGCRAFGTPEQADRSLDTAVLLQSGEKSYLRDLSGGSLSMEQAADDETGPFALALRARRITEAGSVSRAVILGSSTLLTSAQLHAMTDAEEFIMTCVQYLSGTGAVNLNILAKTAVRPQLSPASVNLGSMVLVFLPLGVLAAALIVLLPRRRSKPHEQ